MAKNTALQNYVRRGNRRIHGWLARCDGEIMSTLLCAQSAADHRGAVAEIGVHHGRAFILLALANAKTNAYAIDLFEQQTLNVDRSGHGDREVFLAHLRRNKIDPADITIDARASGEVAPSDILNSVGPVRFFHIDGGHTCDVVRADLALATKTLAPGGIIALDDAFRSEWPEVAQAMFEWLAIDRPGLVPFALGFNKTYLCHPSNVERYQAALSQNLILKMFFVRAYPGQNGTVMMYQRYPLPEWSLKTRLGHYMLNNHTALYRFYRQLRGDRV